MKWRQIWLRIHFRNLVWLIWKSWFLSCCLINMFLSSCFILTLHPWFISSSVHFSAHVHGLAMACKVTASLAWWSSAFTDLSLLLKLRVANLHPMTGTLKSLLWENCQAFRCKVVVEKVPWANTQELCFSPAAVTRVYLYYLHTSKQRLFFSHSVFPSAWDTGIFVKLGSKPYVLSLLD